MIEMLLKLFFFLINLILTVIINLVMLAFPDFQLDKLFDVFTAFFELFEGAFNMTYFLLGDWTFIFTDIIIILFTTKHIVLPVINIIRKFFLK